MSNRKIKIRAIDSHKAKRDEALDHYGRLYRQCRTFHSLQQMDAFYEPAHRPLMEAQAAIREHRELGKDGRFLARIEMGKPYPPAQARTRGQWRRLARVARARGMSDAERLCDGYAERSRANWRHA